MLSGSFWISRASIGHPTFSHSSTNIHNAAPSATAESRERPACRVNTGTTLYDMLLQIQEAMESSRI